MTERSRIYAVIRDYSFDGSSVALFDNEHDARQYLIRLAQHEYRVDVEENQWEAELKYDDDDMNSVRQATITDYFMDGEDVTTYTLANWIDDYRGTNLRDLWNTLNT